VTADDYTQAEIVRSLKRIEDGQAALMGTVSALSTQFVPRTEFVLVVSAQDTKINDLKVAAERRIAPWWSVVAALSGLAGVALAIVIAVAPH
jgi:hypothetical protein